MEERKGEEEEWRCQWLGSTRSSYIEIAEKEIGRKAPRTERASWRIQIPQRDGCGKRKNAGEHGEKQNEIAGLKSVADAENLETWRRSFYKETFENSRNISKTRNRLEEGWGFQKAHKTSCIIQGKGRIKTFAGNKSTTGQETWKIWSQTRWTWTRCSYHGRQRTGHADANTARMESWALRFVNLELNSFPFDFSKISRILNY